MPPEIDPARWLAKAFEDLRSAEANLQPGFVLPAQSLWASQQATEKAIKAVLLALGIRFPFFHDLEALAALLPQDRRPPLSASNLAELAESAMSQRYPSEDSDPTIAQAQHAHDCAASMLVWAKSIISPS